MRPDGPVVFTAARGVDLFAVTTRRRAAGCLPTAVWLLDLATASELAALLRPADGARMSTGPLPGAAHRGDLDLLVTVAAERAQARRRHA